VTEAIKAPRAVFVPWPMGHHFGVPLHKVLQRTVLLKMLELLREEPQAAGAIRDLPIKWTEVRRQARTLSEQGKKL
jgi:hypothetical protein